MGIPINILVKSWRKKTCISPQTTNSSALCQSLILKGCRRSGTGCKSNLYCHLLRPMRGNQTKANSKHANLCWTLKVHINSKSPHLEPLFCDSDSYLYVCWFPSGATTLWVTNTTSRCVRVSRPDWQTFGVLSAKLPALIQSLRPGVGGQM